jgi:hypothetical protein
LRPLSRSGVGSQKLGRLQGVGVVGFAARRGSHLVRPAKWRGAVRIVADQRPRRTPDGEYRQERGAQQGTPF